MLNPMIPYAGYTQFTPALPEFYWDVYSSEQRIKEMCCEIQKMRKYVEYLASYVDEMEDEVNDKIVDALNSVNLAIAQLYDKVIQMIRELQLGFLQWDVQHGNYQTTVDAQRDMFNDVTVHSYNLEQLEAVFDELNMDVDGLAECGLNVKGLALVNHFLRDPNGMTSDLVPLTPPSGTRYNTNMLSNSFLDTNGYVYVQ